MGTVRLYSLFKKKATFLCEKEDRKQPSVDMRVWVITTALAALILALAPPGNTFHIGVPACCKHGCRHGACSNSKPIVAAVLGNAKRPAYKPRRDWSLGSRNQPRSVDADD